MSVFSSLHIPSLGGATEWLNSEPLGPAELRARFGSWRAWEGGRYLLADGDQKCGPPLLPG
jgi:hypothetical protein